MRMPSTVLTHTLCPFFFDSLAFFVANQGCHFSRTHRWYPELSASTQNLSYLYPSHRLCRPPPPLHLPPQKMSGAAANTNTAKHPRTFTTYVPKDKDGRLGLTVHDMGPGKPARVVATGGSAVAAGLSEGHVILAVDEVGFAAGHDVVKASLIAARGGVTLTVLWPDPPPTATKPAAAPGAPVVLTRIPRPPSPTHNDHHGSVLGTYLRDLSPEGVVASEEVNAPALAEASALLSSIVAKAGGADVLALAHTTLGKAADVLEALSPALVFVAPAAIALGMLLRQLDAMRANKPLAEELRERLAALGPVLAEVAANNAVASKHCGVLDSLGRRLDGAGTLVDRLSSLGRFKSFISAGTLGAQLKATTCALTEWTVILMAAITAGAEGRLKTEMQASISAALSKAQAESDAARRADVEVLRGLVMASGNGGGDDPRLGFLQAGEPSSEEKAAFEAELRRELTALRCDASAHSITVAAAATAAQRHDAVVSSLQEVLATVTGGVVHLERVMAAANAAATAHSAAVITSVSAVSVQMDEMMRMFKAMMDRKEEDQRNGVKSSTGVAAAANASLVSAVGEDLSCVPPIDTVHAAYTALLSNNARSLAGVLKGALVGDPALMEGACRAMYLYSCEDVKNIAVVAATGCASNLVDLLRGPHKTNAGVVGWCIRVFASQTSVPANRQAAIDAGLIPLLVNLLDGCFAHNDLIINRVCWTIANITNSDIQRIAFADAGAIPLLVKLLQSSLSSNAEAMDGVCMAISTVMRNDINRIVFAASGGMSPLVALLAGPLNRCSTAMQRVCSAVSTVTYQNPANQASFGGMGGIAILIKLLSGEFVGEANTMAEACETIGAVCCSEKNQAVFTDAGGFPLLMSLMRGVHATNVNVVYQSCSAIEKWFLNNNENKALFCKSGGITQLISLVTGPLKDNSQIVAEICWVVGRLCSIDTSRLAFFTAGGIPPLVSVLSGSLSRHQYTMTQACEAAAMVTSSTECANAFRSAGGIPHLFAAAAFCNSSRVYMFQTRFSEAPLVTPSPSSPGSQHSAASFTSTGTAVERGLKLHGLLVGGYSSGDVAAAIDAFTDQVREEKGAAGFSGAALTNVLSLLRPPHAGTLLACKGATAVHALGGAPINRPILLAAGAVPLLLDIVASGDDNAAGWASWALARMAANDECELAIVAGGGAAIFVSALKKQRDGVSTGDILYGMASVAFAKPNKITFESAGAVAVVLAVLDGPHVSREDVVTNSSLLLSRLSALDTVEVEIVARGGFPLLVHAATTAGKPGAAAAACRAISCLLWSESRRERAVQAGVVGAMLSLLRSPLGENDPDVAAATCLVLGRLCRSQMSVVESAGGVAAIAGVLQGPMKAHLVAVKDATKALLTVVENVDAGYSERGFIRDLFSRILIGPHGGDKDVQESANAGLVRLSVGLN